MRPFEITSSTRESSGHGRGGARDPFQLASSAGRDSGHEAYVSTEQPKAKEDAWLPRSHAHPRGPEGDRPAACEGQEAPRGVSLGRAPCGFGTEYRVRRRTDFLKVYDRGRRIEGRGFVLFYVPGDTSTHRIGLTVPRRVGNAVTRNRVKRRLRDIFRRNHEALGEIALDLVMNVSTSGARAGLRELEGEFLRAAERARAGQGRPPRTARGGSPRGRKGRTRRKALSNSSGRADPVKQR